MSTFLIYWIAVGTAKILICSPPGISNVLTGCFCSDRHCSHPLNERKLTVPSPSPVKSFGFPVRSGVEYLSTSTVGTPEP